MNRLVRPLWLLFRARWTERGERRSGGARDLTRSPGPDSASRQLIDAADERPRVGVGCVAVHEGRVLLVQSRRSGRWSPPGGNLDFGESPAVAAVREAFEETGVRVRNVEFLAITNDVLEESGRHYVTLWMRGEVEESGITIGDTREIADAGWFHPAEFPPARQAYFENLLAGSTLPPVELEALFAGSWRDDDARRRDG